MTAQISDTFIFKGHKYSLIGIKGGDLISPEAFGMKPQKIDTSCYRGYYATYELTNKALYLRELTLLEANQNYLPIEGTRPTRKKHDFAYTYNDLNVNVPFTGKIRLAKDFIQKFYVHMGFQKPTAFKTVLDITLKNGQIVDINDRSQEVRRKLGAFKKRYDSTDMDDNDIINEAFSLDMD